MAAASSDVVLDDPRRAILQAENIETQELQLGAEDLHSTRRERGLDARFIERLFNDPALRKEFAVQRPDELITYRSVNGHFLHRLVTVGRGRPQRA